MPNTQTLSSLEDFTLALFDIIYVPILQWNVVLDTNVMHLTISTVCLNVQSPSHNK